MEPYEKFKQRDRRHARKSRTIVTAPDHAVRRRRRKARADGQTTERTSSLNLRSPRCRRGPGARRHLRRRRHARPRAPRLSLPAAAARDGRRSRAARFAARGSLIAEAGTGTGKTFAYLVPALLYGGKVIVSTGTKTLQDQLFQRDLPLVRDALGAAGDARAAQGPRQLRLPSPSRAHGGRGPPAVARGRAPSRRRSSRSRAPARRGDRGELADVPENATIWPLVTSTRDNCLGANCALSRRLLRAEGAQGRARRRRRRGQPSSVLRRRDAARRGARRAAARVQHGDPRRGPPASRHRDAVLRRAGDRRAARRARARRRSRRPHRRARSRRSCPTPPPASAPQSASCASRSATRRASLRRRAAAAREGFVDALDALAAALDRLATELALFAERSEDLGNCARRAADAAASSRAGAAGSTPMPTQAMPTRHAWIRWVDVTRAGLAAPRVAAVHRRACSRSRSPNRAARGSSRRRRSPSAAISRSTSASSGSPTRRTGCWESPFDYGDAGAALRAARSARAEFARAHRRRRRRVRCRCCARAAAARSCCSPRCGRSRARASSVAQAFAREGLDWPLLVQGEGSRSELLTRFRELGNAVLLGSASFWEGVDVPGDALSVVVIDKLPFAPPDDPLLAARLERLRADGRQSVLRLSAAAGGDRAEAGRRAG